MLTRRETLREYLSGALWALPALSVMVAVITGTVLSQLTISPSSPLYPLLFQGTADDARGLLTAIAASVLTVIAVVLGLAVVALQVASSQYSPRLLRTFLRDRPNQLVLSVFVATFAYTSAGLYTVGLHASSHTEAYPRLAVTVGIGLIFLCLAALVYFVHHLMHSIQIDTIMSTAGRLTAAAIAEQPPGIGRACGEILSADPPAWAISLPAPRSGYVQLVHPELLLPLASTEDLTLRIVPAPGEHIVAGSPVVWAWRAGPDHPVAPEPLAPVVAQAVVIGFERTMQQDPGFGLRQLVDIALRALSPAVNDPYTGVQATNWLKALLVKLGRYRLGDEAICDASGTVRVLVTAPSFEAYLDLACGQIRRFGAGEPAVARALLQLLAAVGAAVGSEERRVLVGEQARLVLADAERATAQPADLKAIRAEADRVLRTVARGGGAGESPPHTGV